MHEPTSFIELVGFMATSVVVMAFCAKEVIHLRLGSLLGNILFLFYGWHIESVPILALHGVLAPLNILKIMQILREDDELLARWSLERRAPALAPVLAPIFASRRAQ